MFSYAGYVIRYKKREGIQVLRIRVIKTRILSAASNVKENKDFLLSS
jgi:hypothetical protein